MICSKCLSMFSLYTTTTQGGAKGKHHANEAHLDRAATDGCKICTCVRRHWLQEKQNLLRTTTSTSSAESSSASFNYQINLDEERGSAWIFFRAEVPHLAANDDDDDDNEIAVTGVNVYRSSSLPDQEEACSERGIVQQQSSPQEEQLHRDDDDEPWRVRHVGSRRTYPDSTGHPAVAEQASRWLKQCLARHETCRLASSPDGDGTWYPQRLLDVRDPRRPRLVITAQEPVQGAYATLSHCWGENPAFMVLCPQTEASLTASGGVPVERLPQTFRDAILTTSRLGIAYLWIDSLCIQQAGPGSADDWVGHVGAMRRIYQRCVLCIAVDRAGSPHEGAFVRRGASGVAALQGCRVFWDTGRGDCDGDEGGSRGEMWTVVDDRDLNGGFFAAPLTRRAWAFQERFLAPRVLHFGAQQVWWECAETGFASEGMPSGMPRAHPLFDLAGAPFGIPRAPLPLPGAEEEEEEEEEERREKAAAWRDTVMNEWQRAVATYAKARLTFVEKDVFAAFAGVAELFASNFYPDDDDRYLAGHFRSELPWCLLWECEGMRRPPKGGPYRAPSWSWASMSNSGENVTDDTVGLPLWHACPDDLRQAGAAARVLAAVLDARVELVDEGNRFGAVRYAEITVRVKAFECFRLDNHPALKSGVGDDDDPASPMLNPSRVPHAKARSTSWGVGRAVAAVAAPELFERHPYTRPFLTPYVEVEPDDEVELLGLGRALALPILDDRGAGRVMGILVRSVARGVAGREGEGDGRSYFERVGFFRVKGFDADELVRRGVVVERDVVLV